MKRMVLMAALLGLLVATSAAQAATIHTPPDGATYRQDATVVFDWAWADHEYGSAIYFSRSRSDWSNAEQTAVQYSSNMTIDFGNWTTIPNGEPEGWDGAYAMPDGVWYWRLCHKSIYGEDDKCYWDPDIRTLTLTPKPENPTSSQPQQPTTSPTGTSTRLPTLAKRTARYYVRKSLRRRFGNSFRYGYWLDSKGRERSPRVYRCGRLSRVRVRCRVLWNVGDLSYRGKVTIWLSRDADDAVWWNYAYRIKRTNHYCLATKKRGCTKTLIVR